MTRSTTTSTRRPPAARLVARLVAAGRLLTLRAGFRVLERVAPREAGARAFALWCRLPAGAGLTKDFRPAPGAIVRLPAPRGGQVVAEVWGQGPTVYLVHGWGGWRGQLGAFVQPLVDAGYCVVACDAPSHGESDPGVLGAGSGTAGVVAHSMGCAVAAMVVRTSLRADSLVLVAPNHDFDEITAQFTQALGLSQRTRALLHATVEGFVHRPLGDFDLVPLGADGALPPTLILHDRQDKETPYRVGEALAVAWPRTTLVSSDGLGHQRILTDAATVAHAVGHITGRVGATTGA